MIRKLEKSMSLPCFLLSLSLPLPPSLPVKISIAHHFLSTYYIYYKYYKIFLWKKFSQECFCDFVANSQKRLLRKIKSMQENCQR